MVYLATPVAMRVADRFDFYDSPTGYKGHAAPTPYLGGAAVMTGFLLTIVLLTGDWERTLPVAGGAVVLWAVGTIDDRRTVTPQIRVLIEVLLASLLWDTGLGWDLGAGALVDWVATVLWVVAVVNAFNLFDNMDGAASAMGAVVSAALVVLGVVDGQVWLTVVAAALCGACVGFLPHNMSSPARIFLGDGGSMPIGFTIAALTMIGTAGAAPEWQSLAIGILLVAVPALDTALVIISRTRRGIPIVTAGRDHITHRTRRWLPTARAVALTLGAVQAVISALALVAVRGNSGLTVGLVVLYLVAAGVAIALLDAPARRGVTDPAEAGPLGADHGEDERDDHRIPLAALILVPAGVGLGISPFFFAYYDSTIWVPAGLGVLAVAAAGAIARPPRLTRSAAVALAAVAMLGLWALTSSLWTDSIQRAVTEGNRLLVYAMLLGALTILVRGRGAAIWLLAAIGAGALCVAGETVVRMLGDDAAGAFIAGRLDAPLGYINGQASFYLLALWIFVGAAEHARRPPLAGLALGAATLLGCLLVLSQSRGVALATAVSALVVIALVPGRLRRAWALVVVGTGVAAATPALLDVYTSRAGGVDESTVHAAARAALAAAAGAGLVWGLASFATLAAGARRPGLRRLAAAGLASGVVVAIAVGIANQSTVRETIDEQYTAFVKQRIEPQGSNDAGASTTRLASGAGNRYEYWSIAWRTWKDRPVAGVGAGGYDKPYLAERTTTEHIRQPHSLQLQALSELGIVGAALWLAFLGAVAAGAWRLAGVARGSPGARFVCVAAGGAFAAWLVHTSVDWMHLLPGLTGIALAAAAALLAPRGDGEPPPAADGRARFARRLVPALAISLVIALASVSLSRQGLAEHFTAEAQDALAADPGDALVEADRALRLDREAIDAYYAKAAALARFGRGPASRAVLLEAARREPDNFVSWTLLGDLAVRMDDLPGARRYYTRALRLNPRDPSLRRLVADPKSALRGPGAG